MRQFLISLSDAIKNGILRIFPNASSVGAKYIRVVRKGYLSIKQFFGALKVRHISIFAILLLLLLLVGCGTTKQIEVVDRVTHDALYMNKIQYDSIYQNDSFIMDYHPSKEFIYLLDSVLIMKVDTMYIRDRQLEYKYKYLHDTTYIHRVDTIPVIHTIEVEKPIKYTPWYAKALAWLGVILLLFIIIRIIIKIYLK